MSNILYEHLPNEDHQHELTMLYLEKTIDKESISIKEFANKYLQVRKELKQSLQDIFNGNI